MCSSYHGPSRSPAERPAAARLAVTNDPYIVSLSSSAGTGSSDASSIRATVVLPLPGGPATTQAIARAVMASEITRLRRGRGAPDRPPAQIPPVRGRSRRRGRPERYRAADGARVALL